MPVVRIIPIKPVPFDTKNVRAEVRKACREEGKAMEKLMKPTVASWTGIKPRITHEVEESANEMAVWAGPQGSEEEVEKWRRLDEGSPEHEIVAKNAPNLVFPFQGVGNSYDAKTKKRWLGSKGGGRKGPIRRTKRVWHPGIKDPREWSEEVADREEGPFADRVQQAVDRGLA